MSKTSITIDNVAFAKKREQLEGNLTLEQCARLAELTRAKTHHADTIYYNLRGEPDNMGRPHLNLAIRADLTVTCQRCLEPMALNLNRQYHYMITDIESDDPEDSDDIDFQEPSSAMDVIQFIEDEIIMALPIAPTHEHNCGPQVTESGEKPNPFAVLKGLIKP
jgi:uncharacterized protein